MGCQLRSLNQISLKKLQLQVTGKYESDVEFQKFSQKYYFEDNKKGK